MKIIKEWNYDDSRIDEYFGNEAFEPIGSIRLDDDLIYHLESKRLLWIEYKGHKPKKLLLWLIEADDLKSMIMNRKLLRAREIKADQIEIMEADLKP